LQQVIAISAIFSKVEANQKVMRRYFVSLLGLMGVILIFLCSTHPIGDFGNYYYGSLFFKQGISPIQFYLDTHFFNQSIRAYESELFFENYAPVPPFSLLFYLPFTFLKASYAKVIFNGISLLLVCGAFNQWLKQYVHLKSLHLVIPLLLCFPLYFNFHQGQTYVLILALLFVFHVQLKKENGLNASLLLALVISLKISPVLFFIFLVLQKKFKVLVYTVVILLFFHLLVLLLCGTEVLEFYFTQAFPKFLANEITEPLSMYNQSIHSFLLQLFGNDSFSFQLTSHLIYAVVLILFLNSFKKLDVFHQFLITLLFSCVFSKYVPSYSLILIVPLLFYSGVQSNFKEVLALILISMALQIPIHKLQALPLIFQYTRLWFLIVAFICLCLLNAFTFKLSHSIFALFFLGIGLFIFFSREKKVITYPTSAKGIVYKLENDSTHFKLHTCFGHYDSIVNLSYQSLHLNITSIKKVALKNRFTDSALCINTNQLFYLSDIGKGVGLSTLVQETK
jgi:hypothetical protein